MSDTDTSAPQARDVIRAIQLLTRVPVPGGDGTRAAASAWAWPLVGMALAVLQLAVAAGAMALGVPALAAAGLALGLGVVLTGGLHEDGLADCADAFWGPPDRERRLDILKDSRVGSFGVLALILAMGLRWVLLATVLEAAPLAFIAAAMLSRAAMAGLMSRLPFARDDGLARHVGAPSTWAVAGALALALLGGVVYAGFWPGLLAALAVAGTAIAVAALARTKIGGQTGDVLGMGQVMGELAALLALAVTLV